MSNNDRPVRAALPATTAPDRKGRRKAGRVAAAMAAAAAATLAVAACGGGGTTSSSSGSASAAGKTPTGITGQTLTIGFSPPLSLNPALNGQATAAVLYGSLAYGSLTYELPNGTFDPDLATSWTYLPGSNNEKFQITLRQGVKFSDGSAMTPQAVANSISYFAKAHGPQSFLLASLKSAAASGADTVLLTFSTPTPDLPFVFSQEQPAGAIIGPKGLAAPASLNTSTDGAGEYSLDSAATVTNSKYVFTSRAGYWNPSAIHYKQIVVQAFTDWQSAVSAVESGQMQSADLTGVPRTTGTSAASAGLSVSSGPTFIEGLIPMERAGASPLAKLQVRQAINYAIDRAGLSAAIGGPGSVPVDEPAVPGATGYASSLGGYYAMNLAKAKQLLSAAGYPQGFTLPVLDCAALDPNSALGSAISSELAKIGIKVNLTTVPTPAQFVPAALSKQYPAVIWPLASQGSGYYYSIAFALAPFSNAFGSASPALQSLLAKAASASSASAAEQYYEQATQFLVTNAWFVPVYSSSTTYVTSKSVANVSAAGPQDNAIDPIGPAPSLSWYPNA
jgi:peptide/nickel transport system substrate-binding protein